MLHRRVDGLVKAKLLKKEFGLELDLHSSNGSISVMGDKEVNSKAMGFKDSRLLLRPKSMVL